MSMDSEPLKCKRTDDTMVRHLPLARKLLYRLSYAAAAYPDNPALKEYMSRLSDRLKPRINNPPPINIPAFGLYVVHCALYYVCAEATSPTAPLTERRRGMSVEYRRLMARWTRVVLSLSDSVVEELTDLTHAFSRLCGYINFSKSALDDMSGFTCPLCIIDGVFADIGWTEYVCPKTPAFSTLASAVSKRGVEQNLPDGFCRHSVTTKPTPYDVLFQHAAY